MAMRLVFIFNGFMNQSRGPAKQAGNHMQIHACILDSQRGFGNFHHAMKAALMTGIRPGRQPLAPCPACGGFATLGPMPDHPRDPLHGITLETIINQLVQRHGWNEMGRRIPIRCFQFNPTVKSSLTFLRKTPWARKKVEDWYIGELAQK